MPIDYLLGAGSYVAIRAEIYECYFMNGAFWLLAKRKIFAIALPLRNFGSLKRHGTAATTAMNLYRQPAYRVPAPSLLSARICVSSHEKA
jgi:hypothetical protein